MRRTIFLAVYNGKELYRTHGLDWYDYGVRMFAAAVVWRTQDPLSEKDMSFSSYVYCRNNPVNAIDPDGRKVIIWYTNKQGERKPFIFTGFNDKKTIKIPNDKFIIDFVNAYRFNAKNGGGKNMIKAVTDNKYSIEVRNAILDENFDTEYYNDGNAYIFWESRKGLKTSNGGKQSPSTRLEHEFDHAIDHLNNPHNHKIRQEKTDSQYNNEEEKRVITGSEAKTALANKEDIRYDHDGETFDVSDPTKTH